ncbi:MAG: uroporphyrinogen-III synthase [Gemmatimonadales bacterium]|nr:uroporphyrinogen-III synthase [Gemmatimonadales bacterium]
MAAISRIVLTRQQESNQAWIKRLEADGFRVLDLPLLYFEPVPAPDDFGIEKFDWIVFTSPQGVRSFAKSGLQPKSTRIATLGAGTRTVLAEFGWSDDLGADCLDGVELAGVFADQVKTPGQVLLPGPKFRMADPRESLEKSGFTVTELPLYETLPIAPSSLPVAIFSPDDVVFFCSPSTVRAFTAAWLERPLCVAIGETTAVAARKFGFRTVVAATPDLEAMVKAMVEAKSQVSIQAPSPDPLSEPEKPETES